MSACVWGGLVRVSAFCFQPDEALNSCRTTTPAYEGLPCNKPIHQTQPAPATLLTNHECNPLPPDARCAGNFNLLARSFPFARYTSLGDLGGSSGCLACCVAAAHPHLTATTYDLAPVHAAAERHVRAQGLEGRVQVGGRWVVNTSPN